MNKNKKVSVMQIEITGGQLEELIHCVADRGLELGKLFEATEKEELRVSYTRRIEANGVLFKHLLTYFPAWYTKSHLENFEKQSKKT